MAKIIELTGAKIVISSTWRKSGLSVRKELWKFSNLPGEVIDVTPTENEIGESGEHEYYDTV